MRAQIVVIGGGVIGAALTWRLAQAGAQVTLVEANALASGTSSTSFAWLNSNNKPPLEYHRLNHAGLLEHGALRDELGEAPWLHLIGNLTWEQPAIQGASEPDVPISGEPLAAKSERLRGWEYPVDVLDRAEAGSRFPELALPEDVDLFAHFPGEGYADVPQLVASLVKAAKALGARVLDHDPVESFAGDAQRVSGVVTRRGVNLPADVVVTATGRWSERVLALAGIRLPMAPTLGLLVVTSPAACSLRSLVHSPGVNVRPDGGSRYLLANYDVDNRLTEADSAETRQVMAEGILQRAKDLVPALRDCRVESIRLGIRSIPADGFPVVGPVPGIEGLYTVATHSGVTMGPLLGRLAATEIMTGEVDDRLAPFRTERLAHPIPTG
jgi:glycine/D-amino acid oxidase-like deaminating enzyme